MKAPKVLIFNACSNGNWGDALQSEALRRILKQTLEYGSTAEFSATSQSNKNAYYYFKGSKLANGSIANPDIVNSYDLLVIGGGGLFAAKHRPLDSPTLWSKIDIPIVIAPCGFSEEWTLRQSYALEKAKIILVRDPESKKSLTLACPRLTSTLCLDPILQSGLGGRPLGGNESNFSSPPNEYSDKVRHITWIPRSGKTFNSTTRAQQAKMLSLGFEGDTAILFHPKTDISNGLASSFDFCNFVKADFTPHSISDSISHRNTGSGYSTLVVSQRYHGCIWGLNQRIQCLGVSSDAKSKINQLYSLLGFPEFCINIVDFANRSDLLDYADGLPWTSLFSSLSTQLKTSLETYKNVFSKL